MLSGSARPLGDGSVPAGGEGGVGGTVRSSAKVVSSEANSEPTARPSRAGRRVVTGCRAHVAGRGGEAYFTTTGGESPPPKARGTVRRPAASNACEANESSR